MGLIKLLTVWKVMVNGMRTLIPSIEKALLIARSTIAAGYCRLMKKECIPIHLLKKSLLSLQRRLKRRLLVAFSQPYIVCLYVTLGHSQWNLTRSVYLHMSLLVAFFAAAFTSLHWRGPFRSKALCSLSCMAFIICSY